MLERYADRWLPQLDGADQRAAFDVLLGPDFETGPYLRLLAWTLLRERADGASPEIEVHRRHATLDRLPALRADAGTDAATVATASALALAFGWRFFNSFIRDALHVEMDEAELQAGVRAQLHRSQRVDRPALTRSAFHQQNGMTRSPHRGVKATAVRKGPMAMGHRDAASPARRGDGGTPDGVTPSRMFDMPDDTAVAVLLPKRRLWRW